MTMTKIPNYIYPPPPPQSQMCAAHLRMDQPSPTPTIEQCPTCRGTIDALRESLATVAAQVAELGDMVQAIGLKVEAEGFYEDEEDE